MSQSRTRPWSEACSWSTEAAAVDWEGRPQGIYHVDVCWCTYQTAGLVGRCHVSRWNPSGQKKKESHTLSATMVQYKSVCENGTIQRNYFAGWGGRRRGAVGLIRRERRRCSVARRLELLGLALYALWQSWEPCKQTCLFHTCSVCLLCSSAMMGENKQRRRLQFVCSVFGVLSVRKRLAPLENSKQGTVLVWLSAKANGYIMITGLFPAVKIFV